MMIKALSLINRQSNQIQQVFSQNALRLDSKVDSQVKIKHYRAKIPVSVVFFHLLLYVWTLKHRLLMYITQAAPTPQRLSLHFVPEAKRTPCSITRRILNLWKAKTPTETD